MKWIILQAAPIWIFRIVAVAIGRIDPEEMIEVTNQVKMWWNILQDLLMKSSEIMSLI